MLLSLIFRINQENLEIGKYSQNRKICGSQMLINPLVLPRITILCMQCCVNPYASAQFILDIQRLPDYFMFNFMVSIIRCFRILLI